MDHLRGVRSGGGRGLGIPPPEKFGGRGQFPRGVIPPSRTMPVEEFSGSDMDESSDTEEEIYRGGRYSIDSSPQDDILQRKISSGNAKYGGHQYSSDGYSEFSSSRETGRKAQLLPRKQEIGSGYTEEEEGETDSGGSSEFVGKVGRGNGGGSVNSQGNYYRPESYLRKVQFQDDVKVAAAKEVGHVLVFVSLICYLMAVDRQFIAIISMN